MTMFVFCLPDAGRMGTRSMAKPLRIEQVQPSLGKVGACRHTFERV